MDADAAAPALLASRLLTAMDADAAAPALLAFRLPPAVDADAAAPALLAFRLLSAVDADAAAPALLALRLPPTMDAVSYTTVLLVLQFFQAVQALGCTANLFTSSSTLVGYVGGTSLPHLNLLAHYSHNVWRICILINTDCRLFALGVYKADVVAIKCAGFVGQD